MAGIPGNAGVVVFITGQDDTGKVFDELEARLNRARASADTTGNVFTNLTSIGRTLGITLGLAEAVRLLEQATTSALAFGETMEKAAGKTGLSVGTLSTLHYAASVTNSDFDSITTAVARLDKTIGAAADGNRQAAATLRSIGLDAKDLAGRSDGAEIALRRLGSTLAATSSAARRNELATALTGRGGIEQVALLQRLGTNFDEFRQKAAEAGVQLGDQTVAQLARANEQLRDTQERIRGAALGFTSGLIPAVSGLAGIIAGHKGEFDSLAAFGEKLGRGLALASAGVLELAGNLTALHAKQQLFNADIADVFGATGKSATLRSGAGAMQADADSLHKKADAAMMVYETGFAPGAGERISDHRRLTGGAGGDGTPYGGTPDLEGAEKLRQARRELDDANRKAAEESFRSEADQQKSHAALMLALLEGDFQQRKLPEAAYYARKLQLEKESLYADQAADIKSYGALAVEKQKVAANPGATDADRVTTQKRLVELGTEQQKITDRIVQRTEQIAAADAKAASAAALRTEELRKQSDALAVQLEEMQGGTTARLKQEDDEYKVRRKELQNSYGLNSPEVGRYDELHATNVQRIGARGAEEQYGVASAQGEADRQRLEYRQQAGEVSSASARSQRAAIGIREADSLQPVLDAYQKLADMDDVGAKQKVVELGEKIYELRNPINESAEALRTGFDQAFEGLFLNLDQGTKGFESFAKSIQRTLQQQAYKQFIEPALQGGIGKLFPNSKGTTGVIPSGVDLGSVTRGIFPSGIKLPGALGAAEDALSGKKQGTIIIQIQQDENGQFALADVLKQGGKGGTLDDWEVKFAESFSQGGIARQIISGFRG